MKENYNSDEKEILTYLLNGNKSNPYFEVDESMFTPEAQELEVDELMLNPVAQEFEHDLLSSLINSQSMRKFLANKHRIDPKGFDLVRDACDHVLLSNARKYANHHALCREVSSRRAEQLQVLFDKFKKDIL